MPNFNTHWLVAREAVGAAPQWIGKGLEAYAEKALAFSADVRKELNATSTPEKAASFRETIEGLAERFRGNLSEKKDVYDNATCFSAYMLGACGPDFWMLPSGGIIVPDFGEHHFDLGHYNRTHEQFRISVERIAKRADKDSLGARAEMAYFLGVATHIAADLVIHQLVNVSAGAYNLLEKLWENENGYLTKNIWSTHNKVEHYWDTYVRLRYLGDHGPVFDDGKGNPIDKKDWVKPMKLPVIEKLRKDFETTWKGDAKVREKLAKALDDEKTRIALERPLVLPQIFADRLLAGKAGNKAGNLEPFIYDVVVNKKIGAYPWKEKGNDSEQVAPKDAVAEATSSQMERDGKLTEANKVEFFSTKANKGTDSRSHNYVTYIVCPSLKQVRDFGRDVFYTLDALEPFTDRAVQQAKHFVGELASAYASGSISPRSDLARFWNLDTGLGIRVVRRPTDTPKEVVTRLDFVHVLDVKGGGVGEGIRFAREDPDPHLAGKAQQQWTLEDGHAFPTYSADPFEKLDKVTEQDGKLLDRIPLAEQAQAVAPQTRLNVDDSIFFPKDEQRSLLQKVTTVFTASTKKENRIIISEVAHRLNLELRVSIADLGSKRVGVFLYGDRDGVTPDWKKGAKDWLGAPGKGARILDHAEEGKPRAQGLRAFTTRLLANLEASRDFKRKVKAGEWNNVVPYKDNEKNYGRNFAISTGRANVLHPIGSGNFDGKKHFAYYGNISPTEQVFFTLYPLVRTADGVFDVFSKKKIDKHEMKEIRRIQAVGFVKIVLYYELGPNGGSQLSECYVDGLRVPVEDDRSRED